MKYLLQLFIVPVLMISLFTSLAAAGESAQQSSRGKMDKGLYDKDGPLADRGNPLDTLGLGASTRFTPSGPDKSPAYDTPEIYPMGIYTFDQAGFCNSEGWVSIDATAQTHYFFHIADGTELDGGDFGRLVPINGNGPQSLWCGVVPTGPEDQILCHYCLVGYGNNWEQCWESVELARAGDVTVSYSIAWDTEPGYDFAYFEYQDNNGDWITLATYDSYPYPDPYVNESFTIPASSRSDCNVKVRFKFESDGAWSDEDCLWNTDGAVIIDDLQIGNPTTHQYIGDGDFSPGIVDEDAFGTSVASVGDLNGDGVADIAVGAAADDGNGVNRGAVWILFLDSDGTVLTNPPPVEIGDNTGGFTGILDDGDFFGWSLASLGDLDGDDVEDIAVGVFNDSDGDHDVGAVWILFLNTDGTVKGQQKISATEGGFGGTLLTKDHFGCSLAMLGDLDQDGTVELAVGAFQDRDGGGEHPERGAVWILSLNVAPDPFPGTVASYSKISAAEGDFPGTLSHGDHFGVSVAALGDLDGDGVCDLAVGASGDNDGDTDNGAVWILFLNTNGTVKGHQKISATEGGFSGTLHEKDQFGRSVASLGDLDCDGIGELAVGAWRDDGGDERGSVWLLYMNSGGTVKTHEKYSDTEGKYNITLADGDQFGTSVGALVDLDGEVAEDLVVGARLTDGGGSDRGAIWFLFDVGDQEFNFQDFESEAAGPNSNSTTDGTWSATVCTPPYGDYACMENGFDALQECWVPNKNSISCLWAFYCNSIYDYSWGGHPEQAVVPYENEDGKYIHNEIWSPWIDWDWDIWKLWPIPTAASKTWLMFSVYRDLPVTNCVYYYWKIRERNGGCPGPWRSFNSLFYGYEKCWFTQTEAVSTLLSDNPEDIQIALGVVDMCELWANVYCHCAAHTHAPLFDNVVVARTGCHTWTVNDIDIFQDNFAEDGTVTGTVRVDAATGRDSVVVMVAEPGVGIDYLIPGDPGSGPAVFCYVKNIPGKDGAKISGGPEWPYVSSMSTSDWAVIQMDSGLVENQYTVDLNDNLFTPGDTIWFYFAAKDKNSVTSYWSQFVNDVRAEEQVRAYPMEMTCLPANGLAGKTDILYVDDYSGWGAEPFFTTAFNLMNIYPDRFDVRGPSTLTGNNLGSRVAAVDSQLVPYYRKILWNSGDLQRTLEDDDYTVLYNFVNEHDAPDCGLYLSGDHLADDWDNSSAAGALALKSQYINFGVTSSDHTSLGEPISPMVTALPGSFFDEVVLGPDTMVASGAEGPGRPAFDVIQAQGSSTLEMAYSDNPGHGAVVSAVSTNPGGNNVGVVLSGFSYHKIRDDIAAGIPDRADHLTDIIRWLGNIIGDPTTVSTPYQFTNSLGSNYPNPFNPVTTIRYSIKEPAHVSLRIYNAAGQVVRTLIDEEMKPKTGGHSVTWDGTNNAGSPVASGVYFCRLVTKGFTDTKKMVLLK